MQVHLQCRCTWAQTALQHSSEQVWEHLKVRAHRITTQKGCNQLFRKRARRVVYSNVAFWCRVSPWMMQSFCKPKILLNITHCGFRYLYRQQSTSAPSEQPTKDKVLGTSNHSQELCVNIQYNSVFHFCVTFSTFCVKVTVFVPQIYNLCIRKGDALTQTMLNVTNLFSLTRRGVC